LHDEVTEISTVTGYYPQHRGKATEQRMIIQMYLFSCSSNMPVKFVEC